MDINNNYNEEKICENAHAKVNKDELENPNTYQHASGKTYIKRKKHKSRIITDKSDISNPKASDTDAKARYGQNNKKCRSDKCNKMVSSQTTTKTSYCNVHKCSNYTCHRLRRSTGLCTQCNKEVFNNINMNRNNGEELRWPTDLPDAPKYGIDYTYYTPHYQTIIRSKMVQNIAYTKAEQDQIKQYISTGQRKQELGNTVIKKKGDIGGCLCGKSTANGNCKFLFPDQNWIGCDNRQCGRYFHVSCLQITSDEYHLLIKLKWICPICSEHIPFFPYGCELPINNIIQLKNHTPTKKPINLKVY